MSNPAPPPPPGSPVLIVQLAGSDTGTVVSSPPAINCGTTCSASFAAGTQVTLTATPAANSTFAGWAGGCSGTGTCTVTLSSTSTVTATFDGLHAINHIIFLAQENRSFDHYFGELRKYWKDNGYPDQSFDGLPQFNPVTGIAPLYAPPPTNPGCDAAFPPPSDCTIDTSSPNIQSFPLITECLENPSPFWNNGHVDLEWDNPYVELDKAPLNGFVKVTAHDSRNLGYFDTDGVRIMGYYQGNDPNNPTNPAAGDLNYYYFMASNFATSDRWFSPVMTRTQSNRMYMIAATSGGYVYPIGSNAQDQQLLTAPTIFQSLQNAGISWKIYVRPDPNPIDNCPANSVNPSSLLIQSYVKNFQWGQTIPTAYPQNMVSDAQFFLDLQNGTLQGSGTNRTSIRLCTGRASFRRG